MTEIGGYELDSDRKRMQFDRVQTWLTTTYWSPRIGYDSVVRAAEHSSLVVGAFHKNIQMGYLRVVSDRTTFAWVCDVYVDEKHRGRGLARAMTEFALADPDHQRMRRWLLATLDAHGVYSKCGFEVIGAPERWMVKGANPPQL